MWPCSYCPWVSLTDWRVDIDKAARDEGTGCKYSFQKDCISPLIVCSSRKRPGVGVCLHCGRKVDRIVHTSVQTGPEGKPFCPSEDTYLIYSCRLMEQISHVKRPTPDKAIQMLATLTSTQSNHAVIIGRQNTLGQ